MGPKFDDPILLPNGKLKVEGPFETYGEVLDDVVVRFLIVPDRSKHPIFGTAKIAKDRLRIFRPNPPDPKNPNAAITSGRFSATVVPNPGLRPGDDVRAIGLSVAVKRADPDPPAFESFTWCVTVKVQRQPRQARRSPRKAA
jgi:hypothetical protein